MGTAAPSSDFSERTATEMVARRLSGRDRPLNAFVVRLVAHMHALVRETRPSREDWRAGLAVLTEIGHASDERRHEWTLLFDLLGVSALVEEVNARRPRDATPGTARGPFYREGAPRRRDGDSICLDGGGEAVSVTIHLRDLDGKAVVGADVETWQADGGGWYENQRPDIQPEWNLRGIFRSGDAGCIRYRTIRPAGYEIPLDGPVGTLCRRLGLPVRRPAHLHFVVRAPGFETLNAELFDRTDPHLADDSIFGVREPLLVDFAPTRHGFRLEHAFILARAPRNRK